MKKNIFILLLIFVSGLLFSQIPQIDWVFYNYDQSLSYSKFYDIAESADGGLYIVSYVEFYDHPEGYYNALRLYKFDATNGEVVWTKDYFEDMIINQVIKIKKMIDENTGEEQFLILASGYDDYSSSQIYLFTIDTEGNVIWNYEYEQEERFFYAVDVIINNLGGYTIAISDETDFYHHFPILLSISPQGNIQWIREYTNVTDDHIITSLVQEYYGDYFFISNIQSSSNGERAFCVTRTDASGVFAERYVYRLYNFNFGVKMYRLPDNNIIIGGFTGPNENGSVFAPFIYVIDTQGSVITEENYFDNESFDHSFYDFTIAENGNFIIPTKYQGNYPFIFEVDPWGYNIVWQHDFSYSYTTYKKVIDDGNGNYTVIGDGWADGEVRGFLMRYHKTSSETEGTIINSNKLTLKNYPNPFNPKTNIYFEIPQSETGILSIFNEKGQRIFKKKYNSGKHTIMWDAENYTSGMYFYRLETKQGIQTNKMVLLK